MSVACLFTYMCVCIFLFVFVSFIGLSFGPFKFFVCLCVSFIFWMPSLLLFLSLFGPHAHSVFLSAPLLFIQWHLPSPFYLPSEKLDWINQFLFWNFFNCFTKTNKLKWENDIKLVGSQCQYFQILNCLFNTLIRLTINLELTLFLTIITITDIGGWNVGGEMKVCQWGSSNECPLLHTQWNTK